jgi:hypothetical protein
MRECPPVLGVQPNEILHFPGAFRNMHREDREMTGFSIYADAGKVLTGRRTPSGVGLSGPGFDCLRCTARAAYVLGTDLDSALATIHAGPSSQVRALTGSLSWDLESPCSLGHAT